ncbi:MAG: gfo/Idh/MocA family oxidoreductase, partial [bacterium]|nr:gfo/Idh/MocA family oxidoreductase [bacterium]
VMGQIDARGGREIFGVPVEGSGLSWIRYQNGVEGLLATGSIGVQNIQNRLVGTEGVIEVIGGRDRPPLRMFSEGKWTEPGLDDVDGTNPTTASVLDLVDAVKRAREPELSGRKAMATTELIFSTYESSRRRARIDLPLTANDSALLTMLDEGTISMDSNV